MVVIAGSGWGRLQAIRAAGASEEEGGSPRLWGVFVLVMTAVSAVLFVVSWTVC